MRSTVQKGSPVVYSETKTMYHTKRKLGSELVIGDQIVFFGEVYPITHFEDHPGLTTDLASLDGIPQFYPARVACSGEWGITAFEDELYEVLDLNPPVSPAREKFAAFLSSLLK